MTRAELGAAYRRVLERGDVERMVAAVVAYGLRVLEDRRGRP